MSVRRAHNSGKNHLRNVVDYYQRTSMLRPSAHRWLPWTKSIRQLTPCPEIGHEKAQSVIDSITSSYAAEGQAHANPMLPQNQPGHRFPPPFFPGAPPPFPGMPGMPGQMPHGLPRKLSSGPCCARCSFIPSLRSLQGHLAAA